jgi:GTP-binding protein
LNADYLKSAYYPKDYPETDLPEIAFAGRSNVGKSSMINTLLGRKKLVKVSQKPGKTRSINWFTVEDKLLFVDLPGYGYAKVSKKDRQLWGQIIETYLKERTNLKACVLIYDIRRKPSEEDLNMLEWLKYYNILPLLVLTKADKLSNNQIAKQLKIISETANVDKKDFFIFSAVNKKGKDEVWNKIEEIIAT